VSGGLFINQNSFLLPGPVSTLYWPAPRCGPKLNCGDIENASYGWNFPLCPELGRHASKKSHKAMMRKLDRQAKDPAWLCFRA
jgi:hypothetical protein